MTEQLPEFPYHPDPMATGAIIQSGSECICCRRVRGYIYAGPVYAAENLRNRLCPWCIADGSAAERFEAQFTDVIDDVPLDRLFTITQRTPGFSGWQQERWLIHCGDGAAFLGSAGATELVDHPEAWASLRQELSHGSWTSAQAEQYLMALTRNGQPTAYLFRCRVCGTHLAYADAT